MNGYSRGYSFGGLTKRRRRRRGGLFLLYCTCLLVTIRFFDGISCSQDVNLGFAEFLSLPTSTIRLTTSSTSAAAAYTPPLSSSTMGSSASKPETVYHGFVLLFLLHPLQFRRAQAAT